MLFHSKTVLIITIIAATLQTNLIAMLKPCKNFWNCAITQEVDGQKPNVQPIYYDCSHKKAFSLIKTVIEGFDRTKIIDENETYIHATFTTKWFKFIDDVEFYLPKSESVIHIRSASRVGKYDLGVNKRRIKEIKKRFEALKKN